MKHPAMTMAEYGKLRGFSSGVAWRAISQSPHHARYSQTAPSDKVAVADIGTIAHQILLEGHENGIEIVVADDWRTKAAKELRDAAYAAGKTPILESKIGPIRTAVECAKNYVAQSEIAGCFDDGDAESVYTWDDVIPAKIRPDWMCDKWHVSVKTTDGSAEPSAFIRSALRSMGYGFNLAFYRRGLIANGFNGQHVILAIEQNPPHGCSIISLDPGMWAYEDARVDRAFRLWAQCKARGVYPCYPARICYAEPKAWEVLAQETQEIEDVFSDDELKQGIPL